MEVGIEDCLHIEFEYNKSKYAILNLNSTLLVHLRQKQNCTSCCLLGQVGEILYDYCNCGSLKRPYLSGFVTWN